MIQDNIQMIGKKTIYIGSCKDLTRGTNRETPPVNYRRHTRNIKMWNVHI